LHARPSELDFSPLDSRYTVYFPMLKIPTFLQAKKEKMHFIGRGCVILEPINGKFWKVCIAYIWEYIDKRRHNIYELNFIVVDHEVYLPFLWLKLFYLSNTAYVLFIVFFYQTKPIKY
jgi:hypothetical protein